MILKDIGTTKLEGWVHFFYHIKNNIIIHSYSDRSPRSDFCECGRINICMSLMWNVSFTQLYSLYIKQTLNNVKNMEKVEDLG